MSESFTFHVRGEPIAQPRANAQIRGGTFTKAKAHIYTPDNGIVKWKQAILAAARATPGFPAEPWEGAVRITIEAFFERPKKLMRAKDPAGAIRKNSDPDFDNLAKSVCDALTPPRLKRRKKVGSTVVKLDYTPEQIREHRRGYLWIDDCQAHSGPIDRWYVAKDHAPGVWVTVSRIPEGQ